MAKAFKITQNNQYPQNINLNAGEYTFSAWVRADNITYKFGFRKLNNQLIEFDISDQLVFQQWAKVRLTFQLTEQVKEFSMMSSGAGNNRTYYVMNPMLEEGSNAGTPKPNELDIEETAEKGNVNVQIGIPFYKFVTDENNKTIYDSFNLPIYATKGGSPISIQANQITVMTPLPNGLTLTPAQDRLIVTSAGMNGTRDKIQIKVTIDGINYLVYFEFSVEPLAKDGKSPYIGENGNWWINGVDTGVKAEGKDGESNIISDLDNENQSIAVSEDGSYLYGLPITSKFTIYSGDTEVALDSLSVQSIAGVSSSANKSTGVVTVSSIAKSVSDKIDIKITGKATVKGVQYTRESYLTINKVRRGEKGDSPILYELQPSASQIKKLSNGTFTPESISCKLLVTDANGSYVTTTKPSSLSVEYSLDNGGTWNSYSLGTSINTSIISNSIQFRLYQDTSPVTMLDIETIMVVEDGEDGLPGENAKWLKLNSTATQIKVDRDDNSVPASITIFAQLYNLSGIATWTYSVDGGNFTSTLPTGATRTGNLITITSANVTFEVLSIKAKIGDAEDTISISRVVDGKDGLRGLPGKMPITTEWVAGREYNNNDELVHYIYYRAGNTWWKLKDGIESKVAGSTPDTAFFEQLSSAEVLIADVILANRANLGGLIFNDEMLVSQKGYDTAGNILNFGEYIDFQFAVGGISLAPTSGWTDLPPTTETNPPSYLWMRFKKNTATIWKSGRLTGASPDYAILYSALKDGTYYVQPYQSGRYWAKITAISESAISDSEFNDTIYKITQTGEYDFNELLRIDGVNGSMKINSLSVPFTPIDPDSDFANKLVNLRNIFLKKASSYRASIDYRWKTLYLPNGKQYDGMEFSIYTDGSYRRLKLLPQGSNPRIFTNEPAPIISAIKIPMASNERIHLKSVWNPNRQLTEWYMNRTSYRGGQPGGYPSPLEIPTYFKCGDVIVKGYFSGNAWYNQYCSWSTTGVTATNSSGTVRIIIPRISYYGDTQTGTPSLYRTDMSPLNIDINAHSISVGNRLSISKYMSGDSVYIDIREYNSSGTLQQSPNFYFTVKANTYIANSDTWDNKYDDWV